MNRHLTLPQSLLKRLEKVAAKSRRTPHVLLKQAVTEKLDYEEWFAKQVAEGMADEKAGRVYGEREFRARLNGARNGRKKAAKGGAD